MLKHVENFSNYGTGGTGATNLLQRAPWLQIQVNAGPSTANPRGDGTGHMRAPGSTDSQGDRFGFGTDHLTDFILGAAFFHNGLPSDNSSNYLFEVDDVSNAAQVTVVVESTGDISVKRGGRTGTEIGRTLTPAIVAGAYQFVEVFFRILDAGSPGGRIEVRVDGVTVVNVHGVDSNATGQVGCAQACVGLSKNPNSVRVDYADLYFLDTTGSQNFDFLGDVQWLSNRPNADTAIADWVRNTGASDHAAVNEAAPDGDTTYLDSSATGQVTKLGLPTVPANTSEVIGVVTCNMVKKTDAGAGFFRADLEAHHASPASTAAGTDRTVTQTYTYYSDIIEVNPATGVAFTPAEANALRMVLNHPAS